MARLTSLRPRWTSPAVGVFSSLLAASLAGSALRAADCNSNGVDDLQDIAAGTSSDCNSNATPDECDAQPGHVSFELAQTYSGLISRVTVADLDGDGLPDLVSSRPKNPDVVWLRNEGGATFAPPAELGVGFRANHVTAADLDGDHDMDLIAVEDNDGTELAVMVNAGNAAFAKAAAISMAEPSGKPEAADLDGDGDLDIVVAGRYGLSVSTIINEGALGFSSPVVYTPLEAPVSIVLRDLDGDADLDLATANGGRYPAIGRTVSVFANHGDGSFGPPENLDVGEFPIQVLAADLNGDGRPDLTTMNVSSEDVSVLLGLEGGGFAPEARAQVGPGHEHIAAADMDGDGDQDLVTTGPNIGPSARGTSDTVSVLLNRGDGTFEAAATFPLVWQPFGLVVEDLDGDGMPEIATANQGSHNVAVFQNRGDGTLQPVTYLPSGSGPVQIEAVDLDGDGDRDLVTANAGFGSVSTLRNTSGSLPEVGCTEFVRGDINADGFVSVSDAIMFEREGSEGPFEIGCDDAADVIDDEVLDICDVAAVYNTLFDYPDWTQSIAPPTLAPGHDPTPLGIAYREHHCPDIYNGGEGGPLPNPLGCRRYEPQAAPETDDVVRLGDVEAVPGTMTRVPVYLTASVPTDAVQLVVAYDPSQVELAADNDALSYEGSYYEKFFGEWMTITYNDGHSTSSFYYPQSAGLSKLTVHPSYGVFSVLIGGHLFFAGFEVPPGEETLIGWIHLRVLPTVEPDAQIVLAPTNGDNNQGVGPYRMRNEITSKGRARYVGTLPQLGAARLSIVGDQSFFRGDSNSDDTLNISDPIQTLGWLFLGDSDLTCLDAADANDDGKVDLSDAVFTLGYLFGGGSALPPPSGERGLDPTADHLHCYRAH